jgi:hypothetical protein
MSTGDFEATVRQSVADHLALIATAAAAAKERIVMNVELLQAPPEPMPAPAVHFSDFASPPPPRAAVNFAADEPIFGEEPAFAEMDAFASEPAASVLPEGAIAFDDLAVEADDDGIPVWEDAP